MLALDPERKAILEEAYGEVCNSLRRLGSANGVVGETYTRTATELWRKGILDDSLFKAVDSLQNAYKWSRLLRMSTDEFMRFVRLADQVAAKLNQLQPAIA